MPGILPMKVIKVGVNAQTRIAQACDRCRSKKIRCDGVRPCCSQCANVGFECKTSDKLSRRAFPRGYTESLEERVRGLECEVRELKELLDEKDEKIDMLSRIHSQSSLPLQLPSPRRPSTNSLDSPSLSRVSSLDKDEIFKVQQSPYLLSDAEGSDSYFAGTSSGRTFIEAFRRKVQESGRSTDNICTEKLLVTNTLRKPAESPLTPEESVGCKAPPRLVSDQLINIFFQEWAPLFPVLHRPTFLALYNRYTADPDSITDKAEVAQLNLVFGIASLSSNARASFDLKSFESQWKAAVDGILGENSMPTLQALVLAQIFCVQQGDLTRLLTYKALSSTLSARLGLHQSQKRFALGTLTCETRKKVFWTLYTVDSFTAVMLGLPKHIMEDDVQCEYPVDTDDENVSEHGFQPSLPGESTKLSSALALFRAARILSKVLVEVFPAKASYDLSFKSLSDLSDELDSWNASLAPHLRLQFAQDKPSTGTISSRSPLLSLAYHYIRALIHRPAVSASIGNRSSSSLIALASSAKHIIQIVELLEERGMCFSFCVNKDELLVLSGFGLMFQGLKLDPTSKLLKDNQKMSRAVVKLLHKSHAPCAIEFDRVLAAFMPSQDTTETSPTLLPTPKPRVPLSRHNSDSAVVITDSTPSPPSSTRKQLKAIASRFTANTKTPQLIPSDGRRATIHNITLHPNGPSTRNQPSLQPTNLFKTAPTSHSEPARSPNILYSRPMSTAGRPSVPPPPAKSRPTKPILSPPQQDRSLNLDYLSFGGEDGAAEVQPPSRSSEPVRTEPQPTDWEKLLGSLDNGTTNIYDACYGGQPIEALLDAPPRSILNSDRPAAEVSAGSQSIWNSADIWSLCQTDSDTTVGSVPTVDSGHADSIFSFSSTEDASAGTGSGEGRNSDEFTYADWVSAADASKTASVSGNTSTRGIVMPADDDFTIGGQWENSLVL